MKLNIQNMARKQSGLTEGESYPKKEKYRAQASALKKLNSPLVT